jgi:hypothetical protein
MKFKFKYLLAFIIISGFVFFNLEENNTSYTWGFYGHKRINKFAVYTLPQDISWFYKANIDFITEHSVDPDKRRYSDVNEAPRHYIDIDRYGANAFDSIPKFYPDAIKKYTEDTLMANGIVPWWIQKTLSRLEWAFRLKNYDMILKYSSDIGHYIADAHVPLHTTENYNGQLTNQHGIHAFWESRVPELSGEDYNYWVGKAEYIEKPLITTWQFIKESHAGVDSVLKFEAELSKKFGSDMKYSFVTKGSITLKTYSDDYTMAYEKMLDGMVERRMTAAIKAVGSLWYTAWVNAGMPDLHEIKVKDISDSLKKAMSEEDRLFINNLKKEVKGHND